MFDNEGGFGGTPGSAGGDKKPVKRSQNIVPVTVKQIVESPEEGLEVAGVKSNLVKLIGVVRSIESTSVRILYRVEDTTGVISVVDWIKDDENSLRDDAPVVENQYYRAIGTIRQAAGEKYLFVIDFKPITDLAEITSHMLEIIYVSLKANEFEKSGDFEMKKEPGSYNGDSSGMGGTANNYNSNTLYENNTNSLNFNPTQQKVFSVVQSNNEENGITPQDVYDALPQKMPMKDISAILEWLVNEGHIYTAIDDSHFRSTY